MNFGSVEGSCLLVTIDYLSTCKIADFVRSEKFFCPFDFLALEIWLVRNLAVVKISVSFGLRFTLSAPIHSKIEQRTHHYPTAYISVFSLVTTFGPLK